MLFTVIRIIVCMPCGNHYHVNMPGLATITFGLMLAPKTP